MSRGCKISLVGVVIIVIVGLVVWLTFSPVIESHPLEPVEVDVVDNRDTEFIKKVDPDRPPLSLPKDMLPPPPAPLNDSVERDANLRAIYDRIVKVPPLRKIDTSTLPPPRTVSRNAVFGDSQFELQETREFLNGTNLQEIITTLDNDEVWPGNLIQGKTLLDGKLAPIRLGPGMRAPIRLSFDNLIPTTEGDKHQISGQMENPDMGEYRKFHANVLKDADKFKGAAEFEFDVKEVHSNSHAHFKLGIDAQYLSASLNVDVDQKRSTGFHTVFVFLRQVYYKVSIDNPSPSVVGFFTSKATPQSLDHQIDDDNPPAFIKSVTYGRIIVAAVQSRYSEESMSAALRAAYNGVAFNIKGEVSDEQREVLNASEFKILVRGGPTEGAHKVLQLNGEKALANLNEYIKGGNNLSSTSLGKPIGFTAVHLRDNTVASIVSASKHEMMKSRVFPYQYRVGLVDMDIRDDHDGPFSGDGDFIFMGYGPSGNNNAEIFKWEIDTGEAEGIRVNRWTDRIASASRKFGIHIRIGEIDDDSKRQWHGFNNWDGRNENVFQIDLGEVAQNGGMDLLFPDREVFVNGMKIRAGNRYRFRIEALLPTPKEREEMFEQLFKPQK